MNKIKYHRWIFKRFGSRAIQFLLLSKFTNNKLANRKLKGIQYPIQLSNYSADVMTLFQIFFANEYEIGDKIDPQCIFDCGANIGLSAVWYANKYPKAKIVAIEPDLNNFAFLKKNTEKYPNIICMNNAVWSHEATMDIIDQGTGNWGYQTIESKKISNKSVSALSVLDVMHQLKINSIDILKIDIEGAEKELFSNNYKDWLSKTNIIAIELHDNIDPEISKVFYEAISDRKYKKYYNGENLICDFRNSVVINWPTP